MPRTKQVLRPTYTLETDDKPTSIKETNISISTEKRTVEKFVDLELKRLKRAEQFKKDELEVKFKRLCQDFTKFQEKTLKELKELLPNRTILANSTVSSVMSARKAKHGSDEGYDSNTEANKNATKVAPASTVKFAQGTVDNENKTAQSELLKTPSNKAAALNALANSYVTPKVKPNNPLTVLRHPRQGEIVISMNGSPLKVATEVAETRPNINIALPNGTFLSINSANGIRKSEIPEIDQEIKEQLELLKRNLEVVIE